MDFIAVLFGTPEGVPKEKDDHEIDDMYKKAKEAERAAKKVEKTVERNHMHDVTAAVHDTIVRYYDGDKSKWKN